MVYMRLNSGPGATVVDCDNMLDRVLNGSSGNTEDM